MTGQISSEIYPKYRVVRRYDRYHVEVKISELHAWKPATDWWGSSTGTYPEVTRIRSNEEEAIAEASRLRDKAVLNHKRKTDVEVVWGPEP